MQPYVGPNQQNAEEVVPVEMAKRNRCFTFPDLPYEIGVICNFL